MTPVGTSHQARSYGAAAREGQRAGRREIRLNGWLAVWLLAVLTLVPLPVGANRPAFAAAATLAIGIIGLWYWLSLARSGGTLRVRLREIWLPAVIFVLTCAYMAVQVVPIGLAEPLVRPTAHGTPIASRTISLAPGVTLLQLLQFAGYGLFAFLTMQVAVRSRRGDTVLDWMFAVIVAYAALGMFMLTQLGDTYFGIEKADYLGSATGTFVNRNTFATFLAFGAAGGTAMLMEALSRRRAAFSLRPFALLAGILLIGITLLSTNSRMGVFAGCVGVLFALLLGAYKAAFNWWRWLLVIAVLAVGAALVAPQFGADVLDRLLEVGGSIETRGELYRQVLGMIASDPWRGFGAGAFEWVFPLFHLPELTTGFVWDRAHSTYLTLWAELGLIVGTLPMMIVLLFGIAAARCFVREQPTGWGRQLASLAVLTVAAIHSTVDFSLEIPAVAYFLVAFLALGAVGEEHRQ